MKHLNSNLLNKIIKWAFFLITSYHIRKMFKFIQRLLNVGAPKSSERHEAETSKLPSRSKAMFELVPIDLI